MENKEIIIIFNTLGEKLNKLLNSYKKIYDKDFPACSLPLTLNDSYLEKDNDTLATMLQQREKDIAKCISELDKYSKIKKETDNAEIEQFINDLKKTRDDALAEAEELGKKTHEDLINLLHTIGLIDWEICYNSWTNDKNALTIRMIHKNSQPYKEIIDFIIHQKGKPVYSEDNKKIDIIQEWTLEITPMLPTSIDIRYPRGVDRFSCIVTLCQHSQEILEWINNVFVPAKDRTAELKKVFDKARKDIKDPYKAYYMKTQENKL